MKVYDFSEGKLGKLLAHKKVPGSLDHNGGYDWEWEKIYGVNPQYHTEAGYMYPSKDSPDGFVRYNLTPEQFGVKAIAFCTGSYKMCGQEVWDWCVVCDIEYAKTIAKSYSVNEHGES